MTQMSVRSRLISEKLTGSEEVAFSNSFWLVKQYQWHVGAPLTLWITYKGVVFTVLSRNQILHTSFFIMVMNTG